MLEDKETKSNKKRQKGETRYFKSASGNYVESARDRERKIKGVRDKERERLWCLAGCVEQADLLTVSAEHWPWLRR